MIVRKTQRRVRIVRGAFTLMELLVVIAILVVLAGVGGYYYMKHLDEAKFSAAKLQVKVLTDAVEAYYVKHSEYPPNLAVLCERDSDGTRAALEPDALKTPWQGTYQYDPSGAHNGGNKPDIWADGPNGVQVGNWPTGR